MSETETKFDCVLPRVGPGGVIVGSVVHYVNLGDKDGKYPPEVIAALVTKVNEDDTLALKSMYATGSFDMPSVHFSETYERGHWSFPHLNAGSEDGPNNDDLVEEVARATHEANRTYCQSIGDDSQLPWDDAPEWQKVSARKGVAGAIAGNTPRQSHESWLAEKEATGWKYGPIKDAEKKEHPCFVPYDQLPPEQAVKDAIFVTVAKTMHRLITEAP